MSKFTRAFLDQIPKELNVEISSYLTTADDISNFINMLQTKIDNKDWIYLVSLGYPRYYKPSISKYNVERIYLALLYLYTNKLEVKIKLITDLASVVNVLITDLESIVNVLIDIIKSYSSLPLREDYNKLNLYELFKYLVLESSKDEQATDSIFASPNVIAPTIKMDDLDTYKQLVLNKDIKSILDECLYLMIGYNAHDILKYVLNRQFDFNSDIKEDLIHILNSDDGVNDETIDIIFDKVQFDDKSILEIVINNSNSSQQYFLNKMPEVLPNDHIDHLIFRLLEALSEEYTNWFAFKNIWKKYSSQFSDEQIISLYRVTAGRLRRNSRTDGYLKMVTLVAQSDVIVKTFLDDL